MKVGSTNNVEKPVIQLYKWWIDRGKTLVIVLKILKLRQLKEVFYIERKWRCWKGSLRLTTRKSRPITIYHGNDIRFRW